jgi:hypothetical protein
MRNLQLSIAFVVSFAACIGLPPRLLAELALGSEDTAALLGPKLLFI